MSDYSQPGHTRVLSEVGSLKSLDDEWNSVTKLQKLSGVVLTDEPEVCSLCREASTAKRKVFACRVCKIGVCNLCLAPKQEVCASCSVFVQGPHVVYKEGVLTTEILGKLFTTSYVRFVGESVLVFAVQPDPFPPAGNFELWTAVSLHVSKYIFVKSAPPEKEEQAGVDCPEPGSMFFCSLQTGKDKKTIYFIADSSQAAATWMAAMTHVIEVSHKLTKMEGKEEVVVEGYLKVLTGFPKSWKSFYFHLQKGGRLVYFKENPCPPTKCLRMLSLKDATCKSNTHRILVVGDGINCACFRPHSSELDQWVAAIALAVDKAQVNVKKSLMLTHDQLLGFAPLENAEGAFAIGDIVETFGLSSVAHNGLRGKVVTGPDNGRFEIMLPNSEIIRFRAVNLRYPDEGDSSPRSPTLKSSPTASPDPSSHADDSARSKTAIEPKSPTSSGKSQPPGPPAPAFAYPPHESETGAKSTVETPKQSNRGAGGDKNAGAGAGSDKNAGAGTGKFHKQSLRDAVPEEFFGKFAAAAGAEIRSPPAVIVPILPPIDPDKVLAALNVITEPIVRSSRGGSDTDVGLADELTPRIQRLETRNSDLEKEISLLRSQLASMPETQKQIGELRAIVVAYTASRPLASPFFPVPFGLPPPSLSFPSSGSPLGPPPV